jgi:formate hydrogenlyase subunit 3/multisubunit Na+/H+ antiporter MnhD subunit
MTTAQALMVATVLVPLVLLLATISARCRQATLNVLAFAPLPALATALFAADGSALVLGVFSRRQFGLALDAPTRLLLGAAAALWIASAVYASGDREEQQHRGRFSVCWLISLTGCVGVFMAADVVSFYILLTMLTLGAGGLIIYGDAPGAWTAGAVYVGVGLFAESLLLAAFVLLAVDTPGHSLLIRDVTAALPNLQHRELILALLVVGFCTKAGLVPMQFWMPLAYDAAPAPAAAVLSGAAVKASVIGLIRFLPFEAGSHDWGTAMAAVGLFGALYGVAAGIAQTNPKVVLAYSSVSQMGFIVAIIGLALAAGDARATLPAAFYATHHLLVKGALFLAVGVVASTGAQRLQAQLMPAGLIAIGMAGLPPTGGMLAKVAVKDLFDSPLLAALTALSAVATTLLMIHFLRRLAAARAGESTEHAPTRLGLAWQTMALLSLAVPWGVYVAIPIGDVGTLPSAVTDTLWPILLGGLLALGLWWRGDRLPRIERGQLLAATARASRAALACGRMLEQADLALRQWPMASGTLLLLLLLLSAVILAAH